MTFASTSYAKTEKQQRVRTPEYDLQFAHAARHGRVSLGAALGWRARRMVGPIHSLIASSLIGAALVGGSANRSTQLDRWVDDLHQGVIAANPLENPLDYKAQESREQQLKNDLERLMAVMLRMTKEQVGDEYVEDAGQALKESGPQGPNLRAEMNKILGGPSSGASQNINPQGNGSYAYPSYGYNENPGTGPSGSS